MPRPVWQWAAWCWPGCRGLVLRSGSLMWCSVGWCARVRLCCPTSTIRPRRRPCRRGRCQPRPLGGCVPCHRGCGGRPGRRGIGAVGTGTGATGVCRRRCPRRAGAGGEAWVGGDAQRAGGPRGVSPLVPAAAGCAAVVAVAGLWWPALALVVWVVFSLAGRGLAACWRGRRLGWAEASGAALLLTIGVFGFGVGPLVVAGMVALGMVVHVLGDALTVAGVPLAWPLRVRGARWRMVGAPLRFRTGRESVPE